MKIFQTRHKLAIQSGALLLAVVAVAPLYVGLQQGDDTLVWTGLILTALGMGIGLWVG